MDLLGVELLLVEWSSVGAVMWQLMVKLAESMVELKDSWVEWSNNSVVVHIVVWNNVLLDQWVMKIVEVVVETMVAINFHSTGDLLSVNSWSTMSWVDVLASDLHLSHWDSEDMTMSVMLLIDNLLSLLLGLDVRSTKN